MEDRIIVLHESSAPGGVCPFRVNENVEVWLNESLKKYKTVYPAAGNGHTVVKLTVDELEHISNSSGWIDVCKEPK